MVAKRITALALAAGILGLGLAATVETARATDRDAMQTCAMRVMTRMSKTKASEDAVGAAIVKDCDRPLRAALAEAIKTGEAGGCTVESCLALARERAVEEGVEQYRSMKGN